MRFDALTDAAPAESIALRQGDRSLSYGELRDQVARVAAAFQALGMAPGARVAVYLGKTFECVVAFHAISRAGGVFVPVNPQLKSGQVRHILADSGACLLLTSAARGRTLADDGALADDCRLLTVEEDWAQLLAGNPADVPSRTADDLAAILYTSGSTGLPKGVMLSHRNLCLGADSVASYLGVTADARILCVLPLSFDYGLSQINIAFLRGATAVLLDYLTPRDVVRAVERHGVTCLAGVPPLWLQLADADWPDAARQSLRILTNSGGRMPVPLTRRLQVLFPQARIFLMYGLTEAFRSTYLDPELVDRFPESIGQAIPHAEVLVMRPDGSLTADDEPGELVHAGPLVGQGYWRDPERTALRYRPAPPASSYGGMAVWSGDTVVRRADGLLYFVGRDDEMIKTSGNRVSPTEVEEAAYATGHVAEVAAFGVPDDRLGQAIRLIAAPASDVRDEEAESLLKAALAKSLPGYMQPKSIVWLDHLPRNANGKIDRTRLHKEYGQ